MIDTSRVLHCFTFTCKVQHKYDTSLFSWIRVFVCLCVCVFAPACMFACDRLTLKSLCFLLYNSVTPCPFLPTEIALTLTYVRVQISPCPLLKACTSSPNLFLLLEIAPAARGATVGCHNPRTPLPVWTRDAPLLIAWAVVAAPMRAATVMSTGMSSTPLWDWPGPPWTSVRAPPSNGCACQKDGPHDSPVLSPAMPRVALSPPTTQRYDAPTSAPSSSWISQATHHPTPRPPSFYLFNAEGKKRDSPFLKYVCNFFSFFLFFLLSVCAIHIDII